MISLSKPTIGPEERKAVEEVLLSGNMAMGKLTERLENSWTEYCDVFDTVMFSSGTTALEAILLALDIGPGDEVITTSFTFNATVSAIVRVGAVPVFVDINTDDFCINADLIRRAITKRTFAIMPVHMYGLIADMDAIEAIAKDYGLHVIEDAAQAHGAEYKGRKAGSWGPAMYSLYATKNMTTGEGGFATVLTEAMSEKLRLTRNHGMRVRYTHDVLGTNFKPTDIAAAIGIEQLTKLDENNRRRKVNAEYFSAALGNEYLIPTVPNDREHAWHQYTLRFPGERDEVAKRLGDLGVGTGIYYPIPAHKQPYLAEYSYRFPSLPVTEQMASEVLSIPVRPGLTLDDVLYIVDSIRKSATPIKP